jgi:DNA-binding transcriptional LysR family regulator
MAEAFFARHGLVRDVALIVPGFAAAAMAAATTDLAAAIPRRVAEQLALSLPLRVVALPAPPMPLTLQLVWHPRTHADAGALCFRQLIAEATASAARPRRRS